MYIENHVTKHILKAFLHTNCSCWERGIKIHNGNIVKIDELHKYKLGIETWGWWCTFCMVLEVYAWGSNKLILYLILCWEVIEAIW